MSHLMHNWGTNLNRNDISKTLTVKMRNEFEFLCS